MVVGLLRRTLQRVEVVKAFGCAWPRTARGWWVVDKESQAVVGSHFRQRTNVDASASREAV